MDKQFEDEDIGVYILSANGGSIWSSFWRTALDKLSNYGKFDRRYI